MKDIAIIGLVTKSGEKFCIGSSGTESNLVVGFARTLQEGRTYEFPKVWLDYKSTVKR